VDSEHTPPPLGDPLRPGGGACHPSDHRPDGVGVAPQVQRPDHRLLEPVLGGEEEDDGGHQGGQHETARRQGGPRQAGAGVGFNRPDHYLEAVGAGSGDSLQGVDELEGAFGLGHGVAVFLRQPPRASPVATGGDVDQFVGPGRGGRVLQLADLWISPGY
jgi:hypothetical protein